MFVEGTESVADNHQNVQSISSVAAATTGGAAAASISSEPSNVLHQQRTVPPNERSNTSILSNDHILLHLPATWVPMERNMISQMVELNVVTASVEYTEARKLFQLANKTIHKIYRVQNPTLHWQYTMEKDFMYQLYAIQAHSSFMRYERFLYHGTKRSNVENINAKGFDRSYSGAHATLYGKGSYFARDLSYSAHDNYSPVDTSSGHKFVYVARVLVGRCFCVGNPNMQHLPNQENGRPFDSAVDNVTEPTIFVIFRDTCAYPQYLYEFS